jgi:1-phosphofructokinase family hexose kinase
MMILCVTTNPALDRTLVVKDFAEGGVFRPQEYTVDAGGKGVNVARAIHLLGGQAVCAGFLGGFTGKSLAERLEGSGISARWTWLTQCETRTCVILVDPETRLTTVVNEPGPLVTDDDWKRLRDDLTLAATNASFIAFSGSLPQGSSPQTFAALVSDLISTGKPVWVDASGLPLAAVCGVSGVNIKINDDEAAALVGVPVHNPSDAVAAAHRIRQQTGGCVVITLGAGGAVLVDGVEAWRAIIPLMDIKSGVGSGDSFLAGLLSALADRQSYSTALAHGGAAGTANALSIGGGRFTRLEFEDVLRQVQTVRL